MKKFVQSKDFYNGKPSSVFQLGVAPEANKTEQIIKDEVRSKQVMNSDIKLNSQIEKSDQKVK